MTHTRDVEVANALGMHARPAAAFVRLAGTFTASIRVAKDDLTVDGKSIMGVLMLAAEQGATLRISAQGDDAAAAVGALAESDAVFIALVGHVAGGAGGIAGPG